MCSGGKYVEQEVARDRGSWLFLGEILTNLEVPAKRRPRLTGPGGLWI